MVQVDKHGSLIASRLMQSGLYTNHFGTYAKSDYETLMFSIYLDMLDRPARDYDISIELGIPESKVRTLRRKSQLLYPKKLNWDYELQNALKNASFNENDNTITIMIEDPSVQSLLKNEIELTYGKVQLNLNTKLLTLPIECYLLLALRLTGDEKEALERLNEKWKTDKKYSGQITKESLIKKELKKIGPLNVIKALISAASTVLPAASPILTLVANIIPA